MKSTISSDLPSTSIAAPSLSVVVPPRSSAPLQLQPAGRGPVATPSGKKQATIAAETVAIATSSESPANPLYGFNSQKWQLSESIPAISRVGPPSAAAQSRKKPPQRNRSDRDSDYDDEDEHLGCCHRLAVGCLAATDVVRKVTMTVLSFVGTWLVPWSELSAVLSFVLGLLCLFSLGYDRSRNCDGPLAAFVGMYLGLFLTVFLLYLFRMSADRQQREDADAPGAWESFLAWNGPMVAVVVIVYIALAGLIGGGVCLFGTWTCQAAAPVSFYVLLLCWLVSLVYLSLGILSGILWFCSGLPENTSNVADMMQNARKYP